MIWLDAVEEGGNGLYLDALCRERRRQGGKLVDCIDALLGDGAYEGEIHIDWTADESTVTFADHWLRPHLLAELFTRIPRDEVEQALVAWCRSLRQSRQGGRTQLPRPAHQQGNSRTFSTRKSG